MPLIKKVIKLLLLKRERMTNTKGLLKLLKIGTLSVTVITNPAPHSVLPTDTVMLKNVTATLNMLEKIAVLNVLMETTFSKVNVWIHKPVLMEL